MDLLSRQDPFCELCHLPLASVLPQAVAWGLTSPAMRSLFQIGPALGLSKTFPEAPQEMDGSLESQNLSRGGKTV
jgi:hypothetical protein